MSQLIRIHNVYTPPSLAYTIPYVAWTIGLTVLGHAAVKYISPASAGSGLPAMKVILGGIIIPKFLKVKTLVAKILGLTAAHAAGLSVGKEGPYVHISVNFCNILMNTRWFKPLAQNDTIRSQILGAACAVGVGCTFGAPVGGVLFSMEVTSWVRNLWHCFFAAVCASLSVKLMVGSDPGYSLFSTSFGALPYDALELLLYAIMGALCGLMAVFFTHSIYWVQKWRASLKHPFLKSLWTHAVWIGLITGVIGALFFGMRAGTEEIVSGLFHSGPMTSAWWEGREHLEEMETHLFNSMGLHSGGDWGVILYVLLFCILKIFLTAVTQTGLYAPIIIIGAGIGRLCGELLATAFGTQLLIVAGGYAVVGSAAFASAVTRTFSTILILFEVTGQLSHAMPVLVACLASNAVSSLFSVNIYDMLLRMNKLPHIPAPPAFTKGEKARTKTLVKDEDEDDQYLEKGRLVLASDIMHTVIFVVTPTDTYSQILDLLLSSREHHFAFPLVSSRQDMHLFGVIRRVQLQELLDGVRQKAIARASKITEMLNAKNATLNALPAKPQEGGTANPVGEPDPVAVKDTDGTSTGEGEKQDKSSGPETANEQEEANEIQEERDEIQPEAGAEEEMDGEEEEEEVDRHRAVTFHGSDDNTGAPSGLPAVDVVVSQPDERRPSPLGVNLPGPTQAPLRPTGPSGMLGAGLGGMKRSYTRYGSAIAQTGAGAVMTAPATVAPLYKTEQKKVMEPKDEWVAPATGLEAKMEEQKAAKPPTEDWSAPSAGLDARVDAKDKDIAFVKRADDLAELRKIGGGIQEADNFSLSGSSSDEDEADEATSPTLTDEAEDLETPPLELVQVVPGTTISETVAEPVTVPTMAKPGRVDVLKGEAAGAKPQPKGIGGLGRSATRYGSSSLRLVGPGRSQSPAQFYRESKKYTAGTLQAMLHDPEFDYIDKQIPIHFGPSTVLPEDVPRLSGWLFPDDSLAKKPPEDIISEYIQVDPAPFMISASTPARRVDLIFTQLQLSRAYVTAPGGRLIGVVGKRDIVRFHRRRMDRRKKWPGAPP